MNAKRNIMKNAFIKTRAFLDKIGLAVLGFVKRYWVWLLLGLITILAISTRLFAFQVGNGDAYWDIEGWVQFYRDRGGLLGLGEKPIGSFHSTLGDVPYWNTQSIIDRGGTILEPYKYANYPMGYMTLLALFSYLPISNLAVVKLVPTLFDLSFAIASFFVIHQVSKNKAWSLVAYSCALMLPTVFINSSVWGQCDVMWAGLLVWSLYFLLKKKSWTAMIFFGYALSMKIMAIFFLPVLAWLWLNKAFKLRALLMVPIVIFLTFIPCYIAGADFMMPLSMYSLGAKANEPVNLYSGSIYVFFEGMNLPSSLVNQIGLPIAAALVFFVTFMLWRSKVKVTPLSTLCVSAIMVILMPFVLPHMHERFFFAGDILVLLFVVLYRKKVWLAILMQISSLWSYTFFLGGNRYLIPEIGRLNTVISTALNLFVLIALILEFYKLEKDNNQTFEWRKEKRC